MKDIVKELAKHQYICVPWVQAKPIFEVGAPLALALREHHGTELTAVCPLKKDAPDILAKFPIVTHRSGSVADGGIILAYCPTHKGDAKTASSTASSCASSGQPSYFTAALD
ncbi:hypothetical protein GCM10012320_08130 [Sinomonas cellulolyticus]|uniref:Uncharacterized protein n=1 Tax=Sinomonas cellulolyticus TaxID=2801916 RepID=A0ABS1K497_9MICC|nr:MULTISPECIES: hypothetical protein [Sinomonas]MBL0706278.1 hypothetical protein [Sinomonas cellulolyticus]GHG43815.1 hypothetical protein GCM10012320_08130 [Sinomonas sp. KCTC 49339]